jgi:hypothetical protein
VHKIIYGNHINIQKSQITELGLDQSVTTTVQSIYNEIGYIKQITGIYSMSIVRLASLKQD